MPAWEPVNDDLCIRDCKGRNAYPPGWRQKRILFSAMNLIGQTVNERYRIEAVLGSGGMAIVYRAQDLLLSQTVALKLLTNKRADQPDILRRFRAEAHTMMRLNHPNVVAVLDFGDGSQPFIAMELVCLLYTSDLPTNSSV